ncbi:hypothetical protein Tco_0800248 [Tanacetum coccineum]|uniref:Uncharacterized protein n=1 Tax=Tanacetum coccineum TaxID=301880 RepID=A0ABQ4ZWA9_9ASTR
MESCYRKYIQDNIHLVLSMGIDTYLDEVLGLLPGNKQMIVDAVHEYVLLNEKKLGLIKASELYKDNKKKTAIDQREVKAVDDIDHGIKHPKLLSIIDMLRRTNHNAVRLRFHLTHNELRGKVAKYKSTILNIKNLVRFKPENKQRKEEEGERNPKETSSNMKGLVCFTMVRRYRFDKIMEFDEDTINELAGKYMEHLEPGKRIQQKL